MHALRLGLVPLLSALGLFGAQAAQTAQRPQSASPEVLRQASDALEALTGQVSRSVVEILVAGYGPVSDDKRQNEALIGRQHALGSGVIVDPTGYIITNAHVVERAQRVRVVLPAPAVSGSPLATSSVGRRTFDARIVGIDSRDDIAVLKINREGLSPLKIADYRKLRQGQVVLAFGSPQGLEDSVTMGIVSSVMRQPDPDAPMIFIQTDAAVNPGNSGGPLVDLDGNLVGINTFILSESGGSQGLNFAIPSVVVRHDYQEIRAHGHVHRPKIGAQLQAITPTLAEGLGLKRDSGLIVSDLLPGGPADKAGVQRGDIVLSLDGTPVPNLPSFQLALYRAPHDHVAAMEVLRGSQKLDLRVEVVESASSPVQDLAELVNPDKSLVAGLGLLGVTITPQIAAVLSDLRVPSGVLVAALAADSTADTGLKTGDVIHAMNGTKIESLEELRTAVSRLKAGGAVALQVERDGILMYVPFEFEGI